MKRFHSRGRLSGCIRKALCIDSDNKGINRRLQSIHFWSLLFLVAPALLRRWYFQHPARLDDVAIRDLIRVGSYDHIYDLVHIFLDPNPDPAVSFEERMRLFKLPRSTWEDYDAKLISQGGGVFSRSSKFIPLSKEMREILGVTKQKKIGRAHV